MARPTKRPSSSALIATLVYGTTAGCGGESLRHVGDGGGTGGTGGTSTTGRGGTIAGGTGPGGSSGGAEIQPDFCFVEPDPGPCRGLIPRFAFDVTTTLCLPFTYGGCEGNANNFESAESCYAACDTAREDAADCESADDCVLMSTSCCGCEEQTLGNMVGVNVDETGEVYQAMACELVDCPPCKPIVNPRLGAACIGGYCVAFETRESGR